MVIVRWRESTLALLYVLAQFAVYPDYWTAAEMDISSNAIRYWIGTIINPPTRFFCLQTILD